MSEPTCDHPIENSKYLTKYEQVHIDKPDTHAMLALLFLCTKCGKIYSANVETVRGLLPNGEVPPELRKYIDQRKEELIVEQKAHVLAEQIVKQKESKK